MELEFGNKIIRAVDPFRIDVLGGTFTVADLALEEGQTPGAATEAIRGTPADQWFVMVSDDEQNQHDSLALIDDNLEFQVFARGRFRKLG